MARNFELSTRINAVSRSHGDSATARAAYRACCVIECEREGRTHDYSRKRGRDVSAITLPEGSPEWAKDRAKLWNGAELIEKNGKRGANANQYRANARTARDYMFTFPAELSQQGRRTVAQIIADHLVSTARVAVDHSIHEPGPDGDEKNWHCHMMFTTRRMTAKGLGEKTREWDEYKPGSDEPTLAKKLRAFIARTMNEELAKEGKSGLVRVQHQSYEARGTGQKPQQHQGPQRTHLLRKEQARAREAWRDEQKVAMQARHGKEIAALKVRQDFALQAKSGQFTERQRAGEAAIKRELDAAREADRAQQKTGIRGVFRVITGRAGREAFDQQTREAQRVMEAGQKIEALKADIASERREFLAGQRQEQGALIDSHKQDAAKIQTAIEARHQIDRGAERAARQPAGHVMEQKRTRSIGRDFTPS